MAKISKYGKYDTGKSPEQIAEFKETGVIPVSGSYTGSNNDMETKNVLMSELLGGGSDLPEIGNNDDGKVLTVYTDHAVWAAPSGGKEYQGDAPILITGYDTVELNYNPDDFDVDQTQLKLVRPVPSTTDASDGDVLTYDATSDDIVWSAPQGGGGSDPFADIAEWDDGKNPATKVKDYDAFPLEDKAVYISVKQDNDIIKHRFLFQYGGSGANFYSPWAS